MTPADSKGLGKYEHVSGNISNITDTSKEINPLLKNFVFRDVSQIASQVVAYQSNREFKDQERILAVRGKIADFAAEYSKRIEPIVLNDLTKERMQKNIDIMKNSDPKDTIILMSAHQPNLFAYSGIMRKIALLKAVERKLGKSGVEKQVICFYGFADHDFVHNKWVRSAEMSAPLRRDGVLRFNINVAEKDLFLPSNKIEKPSVEKLESWRSQINSWISENCSLAAKYAKSYNLEVSPSNIAVMSKHNFEGFWDYVMQAHTNAHNLAEFSSFLFSSIVNTVLDTPVVFANFSDCYTTFGKEYEWLMQNVKEYSHIIEQNEPAIKKINIDSGLSSDVSELLPLWVKCTCGSKLRMSSSPSMKFYGKCMRCDKEVQYSADELRELLHTSPQMFEPRSISMPLIFAKAFDMSCYVGGIGGLGYLMHSKAISEKLNSPLPPTPFWNVSDRYLGIEACAAGWETKRISESYKLNSPSAEVGEVAKAAAGASVELNTKMGEGLVPKTSISERERQLLENIPASLKMNSCSINYAINIGLDSTYKQWIDFLADDGVMQEPVVLKSILTQKGPKLATN
jgi:hypothetical protein